MRRIANKNRANSPTPVPSPRQTPNRVQVQPSNQFLIPMVQVSPSTPRSSFAMPGGGSSGKKDKSGKSEKDKSGKSGHSHHHHGLERSRSDRHQNWSFIEESGRASRDLISQLSGSTVFTTDEINRLGRRFRKLDSDLSGALSMDEFLSMPEIRQNPMARRVVQTFDNDRNGSVDFREFVLGMSQFSMKGNQEARLRFAFRIYDIDNDGKISNGELFQVVKMMVGDNLDDVQVQQIVDHTMWQANKDGRGVYNSISFKQFVTLVQQGAGSSIHKTMVVTGL